MWLKLFFVFSLTHSQFIEMNFKSVRLSSISEYGHGNVTREVTSLRGGFQLEMLCASECTDEACRAFLIDNNRCILIGHSTLPGDDVIIDEELAVVIFEKQGN